jgi:hypothetical protein
MICWLGVFRLPAGKKKLFRNWALSDYFSHELNNRLTTQNNA